MLHLFPRTFSLPARGAPLAASTVAAPLTPAAYLRLRREAAGLSVAAVAKRLYEAHRAARPAMTVEWAASVVTLLETRGTTARYAEALDALRAVFPFDPDVYRQLAADPVDQHPRVCRGCGCSAWDACEDEGFPGNCMWATPNSCTRCLKADAASVEAHQ